MLIYVCWTRDFFPDDLPVRPFIPCISLYSLCSLQHGSILRRGGPRVVWGVHKFWGARGQTYGTQSGWEGPWSNSQPISWGKWHSSVSVLESQLTNLSFIILSPFEWQTLRVTQLEYEKIKKELRDARSINASGGTVGHRKMLAMTASSNHKHGQVTDIL